MNEGFVEIGYLDDVPPGTLGRAQAAGRRLLIANAGGEILVTDEMCTHEDASLYLGALKDHCVSCPLHGSRFDLRTGRPLEEPATEPLRTYPVRIEDGRILVRIE